MIQSQFYYQKYKYGRDSQYVNHTYVLTVHNMSTYSD